MWPVRLLVRFTWDLQKDPPDPLAGVPEQPPVADESGFKRTHDQEFERNWHMVALQRDMTEEDAETILQARQKVRIDDCGRGLLARYSVTHDVSVSTGFVCAFFGRYEARFLEVSLSY